MAKQKLCFKAFSKNFKYLYIVLISILVLGIFIFCLIFWNCLNEVSAWASMIAGIISYMGSSILGIFVFYHSWVQVKRQDELEDISVIVSATGNDATSLALYQEDIIKTKYPRVVSRMVSTKTQSKYDVTNYIKINLTNCNYFLPIELEISDMHYLNDNNEFINICPIKTRSNVDLTLPICFKEKTEFLIGIPNEVFLENRFLDHSVYVVSISLKFKNPKDNIRYGVIKFIGGKSFRTSIGLFNEKQKKDIEKKYGTLLSLDESDKSYLHMICSADNEKCSN